MNTMKYTNLSELLQVQGFKGKPIISIHNGEQLGVVDDVLIFPEDQSLAAVVIAKGNLLRQDLFAVPTREIKVWGKDAVLVSSTEGLLKKANLPELEQTISASEAGRGREIISLDGERNGELKDFLIDQDGNMEGIEITRIGDGLANKLGEKNRNSPVRLPVSSIHSLGKDVIILDMTKVERMVEEPVVEEPVMDLPVEEQKEEEAFEKTE